MQIEREVVFYDVDHNDLRNRLEALGGELVRKEFIQNRYTFSTAKNIPGEWLRVRTDGPRTTISLKKKENRDAQTMEIEIDVLDFERTVKLLRYAGLRERSYQEGNREIWHLAGCDVDLDTWPHLKPMVKIEGVDDEAMKACAEKLGLDWRLASLDVIEESYERSYPNYHDVMSKGKPTRVAFDEGNPFE